MKQRIGLGVVVAGALALAGTAQAETPAKREGTISAEYTITVIGLTVGQARMTSQGDGTRYRTNLTAKLSGIAALFGGGHGSAVSTGRIGGTSVQPSQYSIEVHKPDEVEQINLTMANGAVKSMVKLPEKPVDEEKIPVTEAHKKGVLDPLSSAIFVPPATGPVLSAAACNRRAPIYDGHTRFDLIYNFDRMVPVQIDGYSGEGVVCKVRYVPIAGHHPDKQEVLEARGREAEVVLAPVSGVRALIPVRITVPTQVGRAVVAASRVNLDPYRQMAQDNR